jgi:predicted kinase
MSFEFDYYPNLKRPPRIRTNLVVGPPGSGKSTFVEQNKKDGDIVIDLDEIKSELTGKPAHSFAPRNIVEESIKIRNKRIEELQEKVLTGKTLWIILTGGVNKDRFIWKMMLMPYRTYVMNCSSVECIRRIKARNSETEYEQIEAAKRWFKTFALMGNEIVVDTEKRR